MSSPILDLRAALRDLLTRHDLSIFDEARDATMPYASFGDSTVKIWTDGTINYADHRLTIHVWSRSPGDAEALSMANQIAGLIESNKPQLAGVTLVHWTVASQEMRRPSREGIRSAILRIAALTEYPRGA